MTAQVNRLSLHLHPLDYFIFPILAFYNFLQRNTRHTLKMRSVVRDSNLRDSNLRYCYICPTKSLSSRLLCTCEVVRMNLLSPLHHLPVFLIPSYLSSSHCARAFPPPLLLLQPPSLITKYFPTKQPWRKSCATAVCTENTNWKRRW